jgi:hypothetical protein
VERRKRFWARKVAMRMTRARRFTTGSKGWANSRESANGRSMIIEVTSDEGTRKVSVSKQPLELVPPPTLPLQEATKTAS